MNELDKSTNVAKQFAECFYAKFDANRAELAQLYVSFFCLVLFVLFLYHKWLLVLTKGKRVCWLVKKCMKQCLSRCSELNKGKF